MNGKRWRYFEIKSIWKATHLGVGGGGGGGGSHPEVTSGGRIRATWRGILRNRNNFPKWCRNVTIIHRWHRFIHWRSRWGHRHPKTKWRRPTSGHWRHRRLPIVVPVGSRFTEVVTSETINAGGIFATSAHQSGTITSKRDKGGSQKGRTSAFAVFHFLFRFPPLTLQPPPNLFFL